MRRIDPLDGIPAAVAGEFDADCATPVEQHAMHLRAGDDLQIGSLRGRSQIGARRTLPTPPAAGLLDPADIVAGARRQTGYGLMIFEPDLGPPLHHCSTQKRPVRRVGCEHRPPPPAEHVPPPFPPPRPFLI